MTITFLHDLKPLPNDYADDMVLNNEIGKIHKRSSKFEKSVIWNYSYTWGIFKGFGQVRK